MSERATPEADLVRPDPDTPHLWFALLGAAVAWTVHFMGCYLLLEVACRAGLQGRGVLGLNGAAAGVLLLTALALLMALWSGLVAWRAWQRQRAAPDDNGGNVERSIGLAGVLLCGLFVLAILLESLPALVLAPCGYQ